MTNSEKAEKKLDKLRAEQRWIPVSEAVPKDGEMVEAAERVRYIQETKLWELTDGLITRWRPLPAPPAGEGEQQ